MNTATETTKHGVSLATDWAETCQDHEPDAAVAAVLATYAADAFRAAQVMSQS